MFGRVLAASMAALCLGIFACSTTATLAGPGSSGGSTGGASSDQIDACKNACDQMKLFGCNSAEEQAGCFQDCGTATPSQIEVFVNCAATSVCDPACRTNITPKQSNGQPATGSGASQSSCGTACQKLVTCSFIQVGDEPACESECEKEAYQYQIDCVNNATCDKIQSACGGASSSGSTSGGIDAGDPTATASIFRCQSDCDILFDQMCIMAADQAACRAKCSATTADKRDSFSSCVESSSCDQNGNDCYNAF